MKTGTLHKNPDGTLTATLTEPIPITPDHTMRGFVTKSGDNIVAMIEAPTGTFSLIGVPAVRDGVKGYAVEMKQVAVVEDYWIVNDEKDFTMVKRG